MNATDTPAETLLFATEITVQVGDLNYGNHLANDAVLRLAHEVRLRWLAQGGYNEIDAGGSGLIMTEAAVRYLAQAFYGDCLYCTLAAGDIGKAGFSLIYEFTRPSDQKTIARVHSKMACFDYARQRPVRLSEKLKDYLQTPHSETFNLKEST